MFKPDYRITDYSLDLIGRAEKLATKINETNIAFLLKSRLQKEALNKNAYSSTSIEGNVLSLPQVDLPLLVVPIAVREQWLI